MILKKLIDRIYHPYWKWEEVMYNMWGSSPNKYEHLEWAVEFTGNHNLYGEWMLKVVQDWPHSCAHNLSNAEQNRKAWIGHAACAYANKCPEDIVRSAWSKLTRDQQDLANAAAQRAIDHWESLQ
jgi:hypothetical protein